MRLHKQVMIILATAVLLTFSNLCANPLAPGGSVSPDVFTSFLGAQQAFTSNSVTFPTGNSGTLTAAVYLDTVNTGQLDFLYQYSVTTGHLSEVSPASFGSFTTDVGTTTDSVSGFSSSGTIPSSVNRSLDGVGVGNNIGFMFSPELNAGGQTAILVVRTNATTFSSSNIGVIEGGAGNAPGFQPAPEPATAGILLGGLFAAGLFVARRFRLQ